MPAKLVATWTEALHSRRYLVLTVFTLLNLVAAMLSLQRFLEFNERRAGVRLIDPLLEHLPARDLSATLFALIYGTVLVTLISLTSEPRRLLVALQAYALLAIFRIAMMYTIPLEAPPGMIMLRDPLVRAFGEGPNWAKDLFFSGHTSTTFLCALSVRSRTLRLLCLCACASVAILILLQHAHYTIDVLVAPFVAFASARLAHRLTARVLGDQSTAADS